jgi:hypothetical protein
MEITIDMIKELREKTGCGIMDCPVRCKTPTEILTKLWKNCAKKV